MEISKLFGDKASQEEGKWVTHETGAEFKIRYSESKEARNYVTKRMSRARQKSRKAVVGGEAMAEITMDLLVLHIVTDWRKLEQDGQPFPYSQKNCRYLLENAPALADFISVQAQDPENFGIAADSETEEEAAPEAASKSGAGSPD